MIGSRGNSWPRRRGAVNAAMPHLIRYPAIGRRIDLTKIPMMVYKQYSLIHFPQEI